MIHLFIAFVDRKRSVCAIWLQSFLSSEGQPELIWVFIGIFIDLNLAAKTETARFNMA